MSARVPSETEEAVRRWLLEMQDCVRSLDYEAARDLFASDVVAFGTRASAAWSRDELERDQWRKVWPGIRDFAFRLETLRCWRCGEGIGAAVLFDSCGLRSSYSFRRPGRCTVGLLEREGALRAVHSHFSLDP